MKKKGFIVHDTYYEQILLLSMEERGALWTAMFEYHRDGKLPDNFSPLLTMAFVGIKQAMDQDRIQYEKRCDASRANGKKGGRPKKEKMEKPKKADMDMDMDMDIDMDIDMGMDMEKDMDGGFPISEEISDVSDGASRVLSEQDKQDLKKLGLPDGYLLGERVERASAYARERNRAVMDVLLDWWRADERNIKKGERARAQEDPDGHTPKSYDLDEFFEAAVRRGLRELPPNGM